MASSRRRRRRRGNGSGARPAGTGGGRGLRTPVNEATAARTAPRRAPARKAPARASRRRRRRRRRPNRQGAKRREPWRQKARRRDDGPKATPLHGSVRRAFRSSSTTGCRRRRWCPGLTGLTPDELRAVTPTRPGAAADERCCSPSTACSRIVPSHERRTKCRMARPATAEEAPSERRRPDDLPAIVALVEALRAELTPMRGGRIWSVREARPGPAGEGLRRPPHRPGEPVSSSARSTTSSSVSGAGTIEVLADGGKLGVVTELFVDPEARAVGVGRRCWRRWSAFCTRDGLRRRRRLRPPGHRAAKNFFEESGFTARAIGDAPCLRPGDSATPDPGATPRWPSGRWCGGATRSSSGPAGPGAAVGRVGHPRRTGGVRRRLKAAVAPGGAGGDRPRGEGRALPRLGRADGRRPRPTTT